MASIQKRTNKDGKVSYFVVHYADGKQVWEKAGHRRLEADQLLTKIKHEKYSGTYIKAHTKFKDVKELFIISISSKVRSRTLEGYERYLDTALNYFGDNKINTIKPMDVENYKNYLLESGKSARTVMKYLKTLSHLFSKAIKWELTYRNPVKDIDYPENKNNKEMDFLTPEEMELLIEHTEDKHKALITVPCYSGIRRGELLALKWDDIDFKSNQIFIRRTLEPNTRKFLEPKTSYSIRAVAVPGFVIDSLRSHQLSQMVNLSENKEGLIFPNEIGQPMEHRNLVRRIFEPALKRAGIRRVRFHDLRHSYAAALISAGENIKWIQRQLGHSSIMVTMDIYGHLLPDTEINASARLEKALKPSSQSNIHLINDIKTP